MLTASGAAVGPPLPRPVSLPALLPSAPTFGLDVCVGVERGPLPPLPFRYGALTKRSRWPWLPQALQRPNLQRGSPSGILRPRGDLAGGGPPRRSPPPMAICVDGILWPSPESRSTTARIASPTRGGVSPYSVVW